MRVSRFKPGDLVQVVHPRSKYNGERFVILDRLRLRLVRWRVGYGNLRSRYKWAYEVDRAGYYPGDNVLRLVQRGEPLECRGYRLLEEAVVRLKQERANANHDQKC